MEGAWHMNRIGKNIKKARSEKGYTQEQLAQKLCVTRNTISNYETGHSNPDIEMLQLLAEALKTDPNTLIYGEKKEQSADQTWRKEILKRVIWLVIAGLMMVISSSLIRYGNDLTKDTFIVPSWVWWLGLVSYPAAYVIIGKQIMALLWRAYGKEISGAKWIKVVFWVLIGVVVAYGIVMTVECIRYGYEQWIYRKMVENMRPGDSVSFNFASGILGNVILIYGYHKWLWMLGWGVCGMLLAILKPKKKSAESAEN